MKSQPIKFVWLVLACCLGSLSLVSSDDDCSTPEPFHFEQLWVVQLLGTYSGEDLQLALESDVMLSLECESNSGFYKVTNATVRLDLIDSLLLDPIDSMATGSATTPTRFSVPISLNISTNLTALEDADSILSLETDDEDENQEDDRRRLRTRQLQEGCGCSPPTKEVFLQNLTDRLSIDATSGISNVEGVVEIEQVECPAENQTTFTTGISITVFGYEELVSQEGLASLTTSVIEWWNTLNFYENCDMTNARLISGNASLDTSSSAAASDEDNRVLPWSFVESNRQLQDESLPAPTQSQSPSSSPQATPSLPPSVSLSPSSKPTMSLHPSSLPTLSTLPTLSPVLGDPGFFQVLMTFTGTCYGCSNETIFFFRQNERRLEDNEHKKQRDGTSHRARVLSDQSLANGDCFCPAGAPEGQGVNQGALIQAVNGQIAEQQGGEDATNFAEFVTGIQAVTTFPCQKNSFTSYATMIFLGDPNEIDEQQIEELFLRTFNQQAEQGCDQLARSLDKVTTLRSVLLEMTDAPSSVPSMLPSWVSAAPSSPPSKVSSEAPSSVNTTNSFNMTRRNLKGDAQAAMDVPERRELQNGTSTDAPSNSSEPLTASPVPSNETSTTSVPLAPSTSAQPSATLSMQPTGQPSTTAQPSATLSSSPSIATEAPTSAPTMSGPDLFYLLFELTGTCNGCESDSSFFDQLSVGRRRELQKGTGRRLPVLRYLEEESLCSCDLDAEPAGGVTANEFTTQFRSEVVELDLPGVDDVEDVTELETLPPTITPTESSMPSSKPSEVPSAAPSVLLPSEMPSAAPSNVASEVPSSVPSDIVPSEVPSGAPSVLLPSEMPSESPSSQPTSADAPSDRPAMSLSPSDVPSFAPSPVPSSLPSVSGQPSLQPSLAPSVSMAPSGLLPTTESPSQSMNPSLLPSVLPSASLAPSTGPSPTPSGIPTELPSGRPSSSSNPSSQPTLLPTKSPSPSSSPSRQPSVSTVPSPQPTVPPTRVPSAFPTTQPTTSLPTSSPSSSLSPSSSPSCEFKSPWRCFDAATPSAGFSLQFNQIGGSGFFGLACTGDASTGGSAFPNDFTRVEFVGGAVRVTLMVPCCSEGSLEVIRECQTINIFPFSSSLDPGVRSTFCDQSAVASGQMIAVGAVPVEAGEPIFIKRFFGSPNPACPETESPSATPTESLYPSVDPTQIPSAFPSMYPSALPSPAPTILPTSPSQEPTSPPTPAPTPTPICSGPEAWTCWTATSIDFGASIDPSSGTDCPSAGANENPAITRIQFEEKGDATVSVSCCVEGTILVEQGCQTTPVVVARTCSERGNLLPIFVANLEASEPLFISYSASTIFDCPLDAARCQLGNLLINQDTDPDINNLASDGYQFRVSSIAAENNESAFQMCEPLPLAAEPASCTVIEFEYDRLSFTQLKIVGGGSNMKLHFQVVDTTNPEDCILDEMVSGEFTPASPFTLGFHADKDVLYKVRFVTVRL